MGFFDKLRAPDTGAFLRGREFFRAPLGWKVFGLLRAAMDWIINL